MTFKTYSLSLIIACTSLNSFGQLSSFEWDNTDKGKVSNLEKSFSVGENQVIIIDKNTIKPSGLKPYLYTFNEEDQSLSVKHIKGLKHMEVYGEFFKEPFTFETINNTTYRIDIDYDKNKPKEDIYSISMQQISLEDLSRVGEKITLSESETTANSGDFFTLSNDKYLAVIKSGGYSTVQPGYTGKGAYKEKGNYTIFRDGSGFDVFVYETTNFELLYSKSVSLSTDLKNGTESSISLNNDGSVHIKARLYDKKLSLKERYKSPNQVKVALISADSFEENTIDFPQKAISVDLESNQSNILTSLSINKENSSLKIQTILDPFNNNESAFEKTIPILEILNKNNSTFARRFETTLKKSGNIYGLATNSYAHTTSNGGTIIVSSLAFRPEKGLGMTNLLFCTVVYRINNEGQISWYNVIPLAGFVCTILDQNDNLHILTNGITEEYDNDGNYVGNDKTELNANMSPVEAVIDEATGELISNKIIAEGFIDNQAFSSTNLSYRFNDQCSFIGKNAQDRISQLSSSTNNGITFGIVKY